MSEPANRSPIQSSRAENAITLREATKRLGGRAPRANGDYYSGTVLPLGFDRPVAGVPVVGARGDLGLLVADGAAGLWRPRSNGSRDLPFGFCGAVRELAPTARDSTRGPSRTGSIDGVVGAVRPA